MTASKKEALYRHLIRKHQDTGFSIAMKILKNHQDAEEIVQDAFLKAFRGLNGFRGESKFSTWFYRIVYNTAISRTRVKQPAISEDEFEEVKDQGFVELNNVLDNLEADNRRALIHEAMENLNEIDFTLLTLFYFKSKSLKEIEAITGKDRNYLKVLLQRARQKLKKSIQTSVANELKEFI